jgi:hypothetical protein
MEAADPLLNYMGLAESPVIETNPSNCDNPSGKK